jgi:hypothetical protein
MARDKQPPGWPSLAEREAAQNHAMALMDEMTFGSDPAPLPHPLAGPFIRLGRHDPPLAMQIGFEPDGRLICTGLLIGWQIDAIGDPAQADPAARKELTARALRDIRLGELLADYAPLAADGSDPNPSRSRDASPIPNWLLQTVPRPPHPGPKGYDDNHYKRVAQLYKAALVDAPRAPMVRLAEQLQCGNATAYRWRDEAAARGFLPERAKARRGPKHVQGSKRKGSR